MYIYIRLCSILYVMLPFNVSSCLEGVPLSDLKKSCCYSLLSRIVVCTTYGSLACLWVLSYMILITNYVKQHNTTQHNTTQHNTTQHNTTQHNTTQHNTTQHNTTQLNYTVKQHFIGLMV